MHKQMTAMVCFLVSGMAAAATEPAVTAPTVSVRAEKVRLEPGASQTFMIRLRNPAAAEREGMLRVRIEHDVNLTIAVDERPVSVAPHTTQDVAVTWRSEAELWGCSVQARWESGEDVAVGSDTFSVTRLRNIWAASPLWRTMPGTAMNNAKPRLYQQVDAARDMGALFIELFNWQPTTFGGAVPLPEGDWIAGMSPSRRAFSKASIGYVQERVHAHGMAFITYGQISHCGPAGHAWTTQHPEHVLYPTAAATNALKPEYGSVVSANTLRDETLEAGIRDYIALARELKFDGIRWDGHPGTAYHPLYDQQFRVNRLALTPGFDVNGRPLIPEDPDALSLAIDRKMQRMFRDVFPDFLFGYNYSGFMPPEYSPRYLLFPRSFLSTCAGNMVLDEKQMNAGRDGSGVPSQITSRTWPRVRATAQNTADVVRGLGGHPYRGPIYDAGNAAFRKVVYSLLFATATHVASAGDLEPAWGQFALRYNRLLFHPSLVRARSAHHSVPVQVTTNGAFPPIYKDHIYSLYTAGRYRQMVHILNDPGGDEVNLKLQRDITWPIEDATVSMRLPYGLDWRHMRFYALSPEFDGWRRELTPVLTGTGAVVTAPPFHYWCIVVMDIPVTEETIVWEKDARPWMLGIEQDPTKPRTRGQ